MICGSSRALSSIVTSIFFWGGGGVVDDNSDQPLRRDCACRGADAGFVHLACLTDYAEIKK